MRISKIQLLPFIVGLTLGLLAIAAVLVVVGIFNEVLGWDLFGPRLEAALWGVFGSCLALAGIGVAMTLVVGTRSVVRSFDRLERHRTGKVSGPEATPRGYLQTTGFLVGALALLVVALSAVDQSVLRHRSAVFKRLASEQASRFEDRFEPLTRIPSRGHGAKEMEAIDLTLRSLQGLSFINLATVFRLDPNDAGTLLTYPVGYRGPKDKKHFVPRIAVKETERRILRALAGEREAMERLQTEVPWHWYHLLVNERGEPTALIQFVGNPRENFREYPLGS